MDKEDGSRLWYVHLGDEMVAEGMKMATMMFGGSLHVFTHIYM